MLRHKVRLCAKLKEIVLIIFGLFLVGLIIFWFKFIKDRNPNAELLIDLLRCISTDDKCFVPKIMSRKKDFISRIEWPLISRRRWRSIAGKRTTAWPLCCGPYGNHLFCTPAVCLQKWGLRLIPLFCGLVFSFIPGKAKLPKPLRHFMSLKSTFRYTHTIFESDRNLMLL